MKQLTFENMMEFNMLLDLLRANGADFVKPYLFSIEDDGVWEVNTATGHMKLYPNYLFMRSVLPDDVTVLVFVKDKPELEAWLTFPSEVVRDHFYNEIVKVQKK